MTGLFGFRGVRFGLWPEAFKSEIRIDRVGDVESRRGDSIRIAGIERDGGVRGRWVT